MPNVSSNRITVFPSTKRGNYQRSARLMSEENIVNIINKLIDKDSFVIWNLSDTLTSSSIFQFNIHGYYFRVEALSDITNLVSSGATSIYANIVTQKDSATVGDYNYEYWELVGQDDGASPSKYRGVVFTENNADSSALAQDQIRYSLKILQKNVSTNTWFIPSESMIKYSGAKIEGEISIVDGGTV